MPPELLHLADPIARAYLAHITVERGYSPRTIESYAYGLDRGLTTIGEGRGRPADLASVRAEEIRAWLQAEHAGGVTPASRALWLTAWHGCLRYAVRVGLRVDNPAAEIPIPKRPTRLPRPLTVDDAMRLLDAPWGRPWPGLRNRAVCELLYGPGLRISGVCNLDVEDLDLAAHAVRVIAKGNVEHVVPLLASTVAALTNYLGLRATRLRAGGLERRGPLFVGRGARRLRPPAVRHMLARRAEKLGLPHVWPHRLRTSCATHLHENGADLRDIQVLLGHKRTETTARYTLVTAKHLSEVVQRAHPRAR